MKLPSTHALLLALSLSAIARNASPARAQDIVPDVVNQKLAATSPAGQNGGVIQTAYAGLQTGNFDAPPMPTIAAPQNVAQAYPSMQPQPTPVVTTVIPPANGAVSQSVTMASPVAQPTPTALAPGEVIYTDPAWDPTPVLCRPSGFYSSAELIITQAHVTRADFGSWPDDEAAAGRFILGLEDPNGVGVRGRFWGFDQQDVEAFSETAGLNAWTFQFDAYKRFYIDDGDLTIGAAPVFGELEITGEDGSSSFDGAGLSLFAEGYYPLMRRGRHELGMTARARISLLAGDWNDTSGGDIVLETDGDTMSITELQWGPEFRWVFGRNLDHQLVLSSYIEHQRWQSEWMGEFMGSSISFTGVSLNAGLRW